MSAPVLAAIEAATDLVSVAVAVGGRVHTRRAERAPEAAPRGDPMTLLAGALDDAGVAARQLQRIVVDVGPGSYTGLRIALAGAKMLGRFVPCDVVAVTSLETIAWVTARAGNLPPGTLLLPLLEARRQRLYGGLVRCEERGVRLLGAPACRAPADWVFGLPEGTFLCGDAAALLPGTELPMLAAQPPDAEALLELGRARDAADLPALEPLYLMVSAAEENAAGPTGATHA